MDLKLKNNSKLSIKYIGGNNMDLKLKNNSKLSIKYIEAEYLEGTGKQYIDTGVVFNKNMGVYVDFQFLEVVQQYRICGVEGKANNANRMVFNLYISGSLGFSYAFCDTASTHWEASGLDADTSRHVIDFNSSNNKTIKYDNAEAKTLSYSSNNTTGHSLVLFTNYNNNTNTIGLMSKLRIYSFKIYNDGNLYRNYIPVIDSNGIACMYESILGNFYYNQGSGSFIAGPSVKFMNPSSVYIENCPNISGRIFLNNSNLTNASCTIGNVSGILKEVQHYATLHGFNNNEEPDNTVPPTINGTFNVTDWYTYGELQALRGVITGLNIVVDSSKNVDNALLNEDLAIQTLDSTKPSYNPAAAIRLYANGYGNTVTQPILTNGGRFFITKNEIATITSLPSTVFREITNTIDENSIVTNDDEAEYAFDSFNELIYFTGLTSISGGSASSGTFFNCSNLKKVTIPQNINSIETYAFHSTDANHAALEEITFTRENALTVGNYNFYYQPITRINVPSTNAWLNISWSSTYGFINHNFDLYIEDTKVTDVTIPNGMTSIKNKAFRCCTSIEHITIPNSITSIGQDAFKNCSSLTGLTIPSSVTSISDFAFCGCTSIESMTIPDSVTSIGSSTFSNMPNLHYLKVGRLYSSMLNTYVDGTSVVTGDGSPGSTLVVDGNVTFGGSGYGNSGITIYFLNVIIYGNCDNAFSNGITASFLNNSLIRVKGNVNNTRTGNSSVFGLGNNTHINLLEIMGDVTSSGGIIFNGTSNRTLTNLHLGYQNKVTALASKFLVDKITNAVYIGDGSSRSHDEAILALYLADTEWSAYSAKLSTWYDYNGVYKWYYVTDNLTNCTNTNPDEWPHITRGESYQTTIEPFEGMTLDSVTVEMYEAVDDGTTPNTPTVITSSVYDSSTGEINIPFVTGNIIITASAS